MRADLLEVGRPSAERHRQRGGELLLLLLLAGAEDQVALLALKLLDLLLQADLRREGGGAGQAVERGEEGAQARRTCWAICGLISLPVRLWARAASPSRALMPGATFWAGGSVPIAND